MNDYEKERLANIAKNEALLKEIGLTGIKLVKPKSVTPSKKVTPRKRPQAEEIVVRRTSSRLSGIPADSEIARKKAEEEAEARIESDRQRRLRVAGPIDLQDVIENGATWEAAKEILDQVTRTPVQRRYAATDEITAPEDTEFSELRSELADLSLLTRWDPNEIKITPERIFSIGMHPGEKKLVIAGDKLGHLGIWDVDGAKNSPVKVEDDDEDEAQEDPMIHHFKLHSRTITSFDFDPQNASKLFTSSYDGSIRCLDMTTGKATEVFASESDQFVTSLEVHPDGNSIYFSTREGEVGICDLRAKNFTEFYQLHERKIGAMGMHPLAPHIITTASLDRTMKVWDFRNLHGTGTRKSEKMPALRAEYICPLSVSSAFINSEGIVVATSFDNTLKLFNISDSVHQAAKKTQDLEPDVSIAHNNQTGRWLTVFKAAWQRSPADGHQKFVVGNMKRKVDIFSGTGELLVNLENEYISAVPAVVAMHPSQNWVIAGNASGKALFFS